MNLRLAIAVAVVSGLGVAGIALVGAESPLAGAAGLVVLGLAGMGLLLLARAVIADERGRR